MLNPRVAKILERSFDVSGEQISVDGRELESLARESGTPCFVYSESVLQRQLDLLKAAFGEPFQVYYSMKANPDPRVVKFFVDSCDGIEIASVGEMRSALKQGCPASKILFAGPGKRTSELKEAVDAGVGEIHVESIGELIRLNEIANGSGKVVDVAIRVNPAAESQGGAMRMGGLAAPFGIDQEQLEDAIHLVRDLTNLAIVGIHLFSGTQILDAEVLIVQYRNFVRLAREVVGWLGHPLRSIDFGGGLGVACFPGEEDLDLNRLGFGIWDLVHEIVECKELGNPRLMIEPGRFLTSEAGVYLCRVLDIKDSRGERFVVLDGGMHHHLAASGNLGQVIKKNYPIANLSRLHEGCEEDQTAVELVGPLCTPLDRIGRKIKLGKVEVGDLIGVFCSGAYARSASPVGFLSHPEPIEIYVDGSGVQDVLPRAVSEN